jgi:hypothetical protein
MSAFIKRYKAKNGGTVIQVVYKEGRRVVRTVHIGTAHTDEKLNLLIALAKAEIQGGQLELDLFASPGEDRAFVMERSYPKLLVDTLGDVYDRLGFNSLGDEVFKQLVVARLIEPTSKLDTIRVLEEVGVIPPSNTEIHRSLRRCVNDDYRRTLCACCLEHASPHSLSLLLYDVTTLYFEIQKEDGYRKPGMSKERRLEPQITVGLLVGRDGFPLEIQSFEGNRAEVKTIMEVLTSFKDRYGLSDLTVTADAAMLSSANIQALEDAGFHYIIGSRLAKTPYEIAEYAKEPGVELADGQIFDLKVSMNTGKGNKRVSRRVVYQYRKKRAELDLRNIDKLLDKALKMVEGKSEFKRNRFLKVKGAKREINYDLVASSKLRAGIKGYVTDLDEAAEEVINAYHQLFEVERSFRMAKTDLKARPIFHHKRDSIEAHLTLVFAALAIARAIQQRAQISIKRFIRTLRPIQTGVVLVNGKRMVAEPHLDNDTRELLRLLEG